MKVKTTKFYIKDYPRPQHVRDNFVLLNGAWDFAFDRDNSGEKKRYFTGFIKEYSINVPFCYESKLSGIGNPEPCGNVWYQRKITLTKEQVQQKTVINFEGVDYITKLYVNGQFAGSHRGAYSRFSFDITPWVKEGENLLTVKAEDTFSVEQPRGKQRWQPHNFGCWYEQVTGIWKPVWLEFLGQASIARVKMTPDINNYALRLDYETEGAAKGLDLTTNIYFKDKLIKSLTFEVLDCANSLNLDMRSDYLNHQIEFWSPENPVLYDIEFILKNGNETIDRIGSYFAMREISAYGGSVNLNSFPYYQRLVLDQGYYPESLLTPPDENALISDINIVKSLGFNGVRKHEKIEDERYLYWADVLGLLVWIEMPSPQIFTEIMMRDTMTEWLEILRQNYNHPCVAAWVAFNESWGIRGVYSVREQQEFTKAMYRAAKATDVMRPVISNDGWEHTLSDIVTIHNYEQSGERLYGMYKDFASAEKMRNPALTQKPIFAKGYSYEGQPVMISEFGGCAFKDDTAENNWGYGQAVNGNGDFIERFESLIDAIKKLGYPGGYCYTQLTDVRQEKNGLLTIDRKAKVPAESIKKIVEKI